MPAEARGPGWNSQAGAWFSQQQEEIGKKKNETKQVEQQRCVHACACVHMYVHVHARVRMRVRMRVHVLELDVSQECHEP